ncbi:MAG: DUF4097 family beta strand repeat-containing protein [Planctomycetota bacterium]
MRSMRWTVLTIAAAACTLGGCSGWQEARFKATRELTLEARPGSGLDVATRNGSVSIEADDRASVLVRAKFRATTQERLDAMGVHAVYEAPGVLRVGIDWPEGGREGNEGASLEIVGPAFDGVRVASSNGSIRAEGQLGPGDYRTGNGRVGVTNQAGPVTVRTSNGRVVLSGVEDEAFVDTSNGAVSIDLREGADGPVQVDTSNGSVRVRLPSTLAGELSADTSNGSIQLHEAPTGARLNSVGKRRLRMTMPTPGRASAIDTSNGNVTIEFGASE